MQPDLMLFLCVVISIVFFWLGWGIGNKSNPTVGGFKREIRFLSSQVANRDRTISALTNELEHLRAKLASPPSPPSIIANALGLNTHASALKDVADITGITRMRAAGGAPAGSDPGVGLNSTGAVERGRVVCDWLMMLASGMPRPRELVVRDSQVDDLAAYLAISAALWVKDGGDMAAKIATDMRAGECKLRALPVLVVSDAAAPLASREEIERVYRAMDEQVAFGDVGSAIRINRCDVGALADSVSIGWPWISWLNSAPSRTDRGAIAACIHRGWARYRGFRIEAFDDGGPFQ